jgi:dolichol-phosphate mannosyltransferase
MSEVKQQLLSIVIPIYNEEETLPELYRRLSSVLNAINTVDYEIIFVNDGSSDRSMEIILGLHQSDYRVKVIELSRNFGHQAALTAGISNASGDAVILMDGDLQDPPEILPELIKKWQEGYEVVYIIRTGREENWLKRLAFTGFYRILNRLSSIQIPVDAGIFSLMSRKVVDVLKRMPERNRYISGLRSWIGFRQIGIPCKREKRFSGPPRVTIRGLIILAMDGIFSFSYLPLRLTTFIGTFIAIISFVAGLVAIYLRLSKILLLPLGWTSTIVIITFLSGLILLMLGVVGEYIARIYEEIKARPLYIIRQQIGFESDE